MTDDLHRSEDAQTRPGSSMRIRARQQAAIADIALQALKAKDLSSLFNDVVRSTSLALGVEFVQVLELRQDGQTLLLRSGTGWRPGLVGEATVATEIDSQADFTQQASARVFDDLRTETRWVALSLLLEHGVVSGASTVIQTPNGPFGILGAYTRARRAFTQDDVHFLQSVANVLAGAVERSSMEAALRASEERLRLVTEQLPAHLWTTDAHLRVTSLSGSVLGRLEIVPGEYVGRTLAEILTSGRPEVLEAHSRALAGESGECELEFRDRVLEAQVHPLRDAEGQVAGCLGLALDVTDRRRATEALSAVEERLRLMMYAARDLAIIMLDPNGRIVDWNRGGSVLFGYRTQEVLGQHVATLYTEEDRQAGLPELELGQVARDGRAEDSHWLLRKDGSRFWAGGLTLALGEGRLRGFAKVVRDLTELKEAHGAQEAHARQQQAVAELGRRALADPDLDTLLDDVAGTVVRTLAVERARVLELLPDDGVLRFRAGAGWQADLIGAATMDVGSGSQAGHTLLVKEPVVVEDLRTESRFRVPALLLDHGILSSVTVPIGDDDAPWGVLGVESAERRIFTSDDMLFLQAVANVLATAIRRKEYEERLARDRIEMARLAEQDRLRADFVASMSHDLRTPLTSIRAAIGLLEQVAGDQLQPANTELLSNARRNAERLDGLIENLLTVNELEAGSLSLELAAIDFRLVVVDAIAAVHPLIEEKGQRLEADLPSQLPLAGDQHRLSQVVVNLLANAHRHTGPGTRIVVHGTIEADTIRLTVADDGLGIPPDQRVVIFRRFHRLGAAGGSGLGLAIAQGIVRLHSGRIWVDEAPEGGAAFHLVLPCHKPGDNA